MTKLRIEIENESLLTADERSVLNAIAANPGVETMNAAEKMLRWSFEGGKDGLWMVYRGGNHVALIKSGERVLLMAFDRVAEVA